MTKSTPSSTMKAPNMTTAPTDSAARHKITLELDSTTAAILAAAAARGGFLSRQDFIRALIIHNEEAPLHATARATAYFNGWINALRQITPGKAWSKSRIDAEIKELAFIVEQMENQGMRHHTPAW